METKEYKLTDICDFQGGTQPPKEEWINEPREGFVRMLQIRDFTQGKEEHIEYVKDTKKLNKCEEDDILIGRYGASVGKILTGLAGAYNVAIIKTIPNVELLSKRYLYYVLTGTDFQNFITTIGARAAQAGFNKNDLSFFKLHLPSLKNQEKIADVLERSKSLITKRQQSIDFLESFLSMKFLEMFGEGHKSEFPVKTFDDVSTKITDGEHGTVARTSSGRLYLMARNITNDNRLSLEEVSYISEKDHKKIYKRCNPETDDILLVCVGATIGKVTLVPEMEEFSLARSVALIKPNRNLINPRYLLWFIKSPFGDRQIQLSRNEAAQAGLYTGKIKEIKLPVPPIELQNSFSDYSLLIESIRVKMESSLQKLNNLYNSLCNRALKGELEVIERIVLEGTIKVQPKITGEVVVLDKINKELEEFHKNQPHTGAPDEIDNTIRQLEAELKIKGEIPFWDEYVKYRIVKGKFKEPFTFDQLWEEITKFPFETVPEYDEVATLLFKWLSEENAFIRQQFNESTKQIELIVNETAKA